MCKLDELKEKLLSLPDLPIFIAGHKSPDQDSIGSCLVLCRVLRALGKQAWILCHKEDTSLVSWQNIDPLIITDFELLLQNEKFLKENNNFSKNIYPNLDNEKNIKTENLQKMLHNGYIFIALDLNDFSRLDCPQIFLNATYTINIDHHQGNTTNANFVMSCSAPSSTCEIMYRLIEKMDKSLLTLENCENLYCGILTDTNSFSRRLSNRTLEIVQNLVNQGVDYYKLNQLVLWRRTATELECSGLLAQKIVNAGKFCYVVCDKNMEYAKSLSQNVLFKKVAEDLRKIDGINIFVFLLDYGDKIVAKVMTNNCDIADKISSQFEGGGGHKKEAGFTTGLGIDKILNIISNYLNG